MLIRITEPELSILEREYENAIQGNLEDEDDVFFPLNDLGMCKIMKKECRYIIDEARKQFNNGKKNVNLVINHF